MKIELLLSGIGGQGVITAGETLCNAAIQADYRVTFVPFYGQEKRGGRTMCNIVISDSLESPIISEADLMLIMDERSLQDYQGLISPEGVLILNSSLVSIEPKCTCKNIYRVPTYELAAELGNTKAANIVALGFITRLLPLIPYEAVEQEVARFFAQKPKLISLNLAALKKGYELANAQ